MTINIYLRDNILRVWLFPHVLNGRNWLSPRMSSKCACHFQCCRHYPGWHRLGESSFRLIFKLVNQISLPFLASIKPFYRLHRGVSICVASLRMFQHVWLLQNTASLQFLWRTSSSIFVLLIHPIRTSMDPTFSTVTSILLEASQVISVLRFKISLQEMRNLRSTQPHNNSAKTPWLLVSWTDLLYPG